MEKTFEQALQEIESIVFSMEKGTLSLDDSLKSYETGMKLINECTKKLLSAEKSIKVMETDFKNNLLESDLEEHNKLDGSETVNAFVKKTGMEKSVSSKKLRKPKETPPTKAEKVEEVAEDDSAENEDSELNLF
jgi:exodeoxyribonuclease VII small subunit